MNQPYSYLDLGWYLMVYSILGWTAEVCICAVTSGQFINRGLLNLPVSLPWGLTATVLMLALPTVPGGYLPQFLMTIAVYVLIRSLSSHVVCRVSGCKVSESRVPLSLSILRTLTAAAACYIQYLLIHPILLVFFAFLPRFVTDWIAVGFLLLTALDFLCVVYTLRTHRLTPATAAALAGSQRLADRITNSIWDRLCKAYPELETERETSHGFAHGLCTDKLLWVFFISSILGAMIEMVFCRMTGGIWMNRSSLLYGPFSVVWGIGAVILTVVLQRLAGKPDRHVFLAGCLVGGVYEYLCSVFTEYVFGTVFWDYSHMPLNLGGRINLLYCIFWGLLAVLWLRVLYPPMEKAIERIPPLPGKVLTWILASLMVCNILVTGAAMLRYTMRQTDTSSHGILTDFLDTRYPDDYMEHRWPNMILTDS